ncbi:HPr(Ser) kinase/phosphatase [Acidobacteria bacterium AH-259-D05]|nr:HPr(Ser) kinase/phosphatase [Acidobacteria bacterium AH-259-D05]
MTAEEKLHKPTTSVRALERLSDQRLKLTLLAGADGLDNKITSPRMQKLGLALSGYLDYVHEGRVQLVGRTEINYLKTLSAADRKAAINRIFSCKLSCLVITSNLNPPASLTRNCDRHKVPIFQTDALSSIVITEITGFLQEQLASKTTIHGVLMEIFGLGVLLLGPSGIGKSECGLDLILRGHRLVSDDLVVIRKFGSDRLLGSGPTDFQFHMELRGLGIINIKELFGVSVLSPKKIIDLAIDLVRWDAKKEYDRLGLEERRYPLLDMSIPLITMPVASGRNLATLVEVAVRIQMLKSQGYSPSSDFFRKLDSRLRASDATRH